MPAGADAVVIQEDIQAQDGRIVFPRSIKAGQHLRRRGEDFPAGDELLRPGQRLNAWKLALLSTAGVEKIEVFRRARVLVVATGNELVAPGQALQPGQICESNRLATLLQIRALGAEAIDGGTARDEPDALRALLQKAGDYADRTEARPQARDGLMAASISSSPAAVPRSVTTISSSRCLPRLANQLLEGAHQAGKTHRLRPPRRAHAFFALPGNPVSSLVTFLLFVEPALCAWHHASSGMIELAATASNGFRRRAGRTEFLRLYSENGRLMAEALKGQGSHQLRPMADTNGFIRVEAESDGFEAGAAVVAIPLFPAKENPRVCGQ